jgi:hypothetical protein
MKMLCRLDESGPTGLNSSRCRHKRKVESQMAAAKVKWTLSIVRVVTRSWLHRGP